MLAEARVKHPFLLCSLEFYLMTQAVVEFWNSVPEALGSVLVLRKEQGEEGEEDGRRQNNIALYKDQKEF